MQPTTSLGKRPQATLNGAPPPAKRVTNEPASLELDHQQLTQILARHTPENRVRLLMSALQRLGMGPSAAALYHAPIPPSATSATPSATEADEEAPTYSYFE